MFILQICFWKTSPVNSETFFWWAISCFVNHLSPDITELEFTHQNSVIGTLESFRIILVPSLELFHKAQTGHILRINVVTQLLFSPTTGIACMTPPCSGCFHGSLICFALVAGRILPVVVQRYDIITYRMIRQCNIIKDLVIRDSLILSCQPYKKKKSLLGSANSSTDNSYGNRIWHSFSPWENSSTLTHSVKTLAQVFKLRS